MLCNYYLCNLSPYTVYFHLQLLITCPLGVWSINFPTPSTETGATPRGAEHLLSRQLCLQDLEKRNESNEQIVIASNTYHKRMSTLQLHGCLILGQIRSPYAHSLTLSKTSLIINEFRTISPTAVCVHGSNLPLSPQCSPVDAPGRQCPRRSLGNKGMPRQHWRQLQGKCC